MEFLLFHLLDRQEKKGEEEEGQGRRHRRGDKKKTRSCDKIKGWKDNFSFSRMGFFLQPADGGMKLGEKDGEREQERGGRRRRGGCSRRAL